MAALKREDLWTLEEYSRRRKEFRAQVMAHKKHRQVALGDHARLYFEDELTIRYQIQEMLRIEKVFDVEGIQDELDAYNPLIPDGSNLKATFMLEYDDPAERAQKVQQLIGIEQQIWLQVDGFDKVIPIADEDLARQTTEKTSTVHFLRFELTPPMAAAVKSGADIAVGIDHPGYHIAPIIIDSAARNSLEADLV